MSLMMHGEDHKQQKQHEECLQKLSKDCFDDFYAVHKCSLTKCKPTIGLQELIPTNTTTKTTI